MPPLDTGIAVTLNVSAGAVASVQIRSTRLTQASRLLAGRTADQVATILPTVYALCGTAQGLAAAAAIEAAAGVVPSPAQRMARRFLLQLETVGEHALGILRDWPELLDEPPELAAAKPLRPMLAAAKRGLYPDGDWAKAGGGRLAINPGTLIELMRQVEDVAARIFAGSPETWLREPVLFHAWVRRGETIAARLLRRILDGGLAGFGRSPVPLMPEAGPPDLTWRLAGDRDGSYVTRPDTAGMPLETGSLARQADVPLIAELLVEHGHGLIARFAARLVEIAEALRELEELVLDLSDDAGAPGAIAGSGIGFGLIDAARGLLVHRVELEEGVVRRYQILAPTEWNFHPDGPLRRGLVGVAAGPDLAWRARLLAAALDPCVACSVEVVEYA